MKKLLLMAAFVAGPILYAQQKPISSTELQKAEVLQKEQSKTTQATQAIQSSQATRATEAKSVNLSDTKAAKKKTSTKNTEAKTTRNDAKASSFKSTVEN